MGDEKTLFAGVEETILTGSLTLTGLLTCINFPPETLKDADDGSVGVMSSTDNDRGRSTMEELLVAGGVEDDDFEERNSVGLDGTD